MAASTGRETPGVCLRIRHRLSHQRHQRGSAAPTPWRSPEGNAKAEHIRRRAGRGALAHCYPAYGRDFSTSEQPLELRIRQNRYPRRGRALWGDAAGCRVILRDRLVESPSSSFGNPSNNRGPRIDPYRISP